MLLNPIQTLTTLEHVQQQLADICDESFHESQAPEQKPLRAYNQHETRQVTGIRDPRSLNKLCEQLGIATKDGNKWWVDQLDINKLMDAKGKVPFNETEEGKAQKGPVKIAVANSKGGVSKTTLTTTISAGLCCELKHRYRVLILDLDIQHSSSLLVVPEFNHQTDYTIGDLIMGKRLKGDESLTFKELCNKAVKATNVPGQYIIPSAKRDAEFNIWVEEQKLLASQEGREFNSYSMLDSIIEAVSDRVDVVLMDTAPTFSALSACGHWSADVWVCPLKPSYLDIDATEGYYSQMVRLYKLFIGLGHPGLNAIKLVVTQLDASKRIEGEIKGDLIAKLKGDMFKSDFKFSQAITNCTSVASTIFELSKSDYLGTKSSMIKAQEDARLVVWEFDTLIRTAIQNQA